MKAHIPHDGLRLEFSTFDDELYRPESFKHSSKKLRREKG
jgi:hypothetical protein